MGLKTSDVHTGEHYIISLIVVAYCADTNSHCYIYQYSAVCVCARVCACVCVCVLRSGSHFNFCSLKLPQVYGHRGGVILFAYINCWLLLFNLLSDTTIFIHKSEEINPKF